MALFKKLDSNTKRRYINKDEIVVQTVSVTSTKITNKIDVTVGDTTTTVEDWEISFADLASIKKYSSNTLVGIRVSPVTGVVKPFNYSLITYTTREDTRSAAITPTTDSNIQIIIKDPTGNFNTSDIIVFTPSSDYTLSSSDTFTATSSSIYDMLDTITVTKDTSYVNSEYTKYTVQSASYVESIVADQAVGIIDRTNVKLTAGSGSIRVLKSSVETDTAEIKFGFSNYPRLVDFKDA